MLSTLLLLTIVAVFAFGVAAGYWVICGLLYWLDRSRTPRVATAAPSLAPQTSGD